MNNSTRDIFVTRTRIISFIRKFLDNRGFLEVETPMMNMIPGGAAGKIIIYYYKIKIYLY